MVGLGFLHYKQERGDEMKCKLACPLLHTHNYDCSYSDTHEDMKPDEELSAKMLNWIKKLGLDKVTNYMQTLTMISKLLLVMFFVLFVLIDSGQSKKMTQMFTVQH